MDIVVFLTVTDSLLEGVSCKMLLYLISKLRLYLVLFLFSSFNFLYIFILVFQCDCCAQPFGFPLYFFCQSSASLNVVTIIIYLRPTVWKLLSHSNYKLFNNKNQPKYHRIWRKKRQGRRRKKDPQSTVKVKNKRPKTTDQQSRKEFLRASKV